MSGSGVLIFIQIWVKKEQWVQRVHLSGNNMSIVVGVGVKMIIVVSFHVVKGSMILEVLEV